MTVATRAPIMSTYKRWPVTFVSGKAATLTSRDGREFTDLVAGIAVASVGHSHPRVAAAIAEQADALIHVSNLYETEPQQTLAAKLYELTGGKHSFFCNSGAESIEAAIKLARRWAGKNKGAGAHRIVCATGGFHGRTFGALSATGQPAKQEPFAPIVPGFTHVTYGDLDELQAAIGDDVAAVLLEPIQGEAGVVVPPEGYLQEVAELCRAADVLLMLDEVQTGLGRTGRWLAQEHFDVDPDVTCLAKGLGGGLPIGACLAKPEVSTAFEPGDHATTFGGGPVPAAAALATLQVIEEEHLVERSAALGAKAIAALSTAVGHRAEVRGKGLMIGIDLGVPRAREVAEYAFDRGVLVNDATPQVVRVVPPLVIDEATLFAALDVIEEAIDAL